MERNSGSAKSLVGRAHLDRPARAHRARAGRVSAGAKRALVQEKEDAAGAADDDGFTGADAAAHAAAARAKEYPDHHVDPDARLVRSRRRRRLSRRTRTRSPPRKKRRAKTQNFLPGQDGKERPFMNLETHEQSFAQDGSAPKPTPGADRAAEAFADAGSNPSRPTATPEPTRSARAAHENADADSLAAFHRRENRRADTDRDADATPPPKNEAARAGLRLIAISSSRRSSAAGSTIAGAPRSTPSALRSAVIANSSRTRSASRWYFMINERVDLASIGTTALTFEIAADGTDQQHAHHREHDERSGREHRACARSRRRSSRRFPRNCCRRCPDGHFTMEESFTIFANQ